MTSGNSIEKIVKKSLASNIGKSAIGIGLGLVGFAGNAIANQTLINCETGQLPCQKICSLENGTKTYEKSCQYILRPEYDLNGDGKITLKEYIDGRLIDVLDKSKFFIGRDKGLFIADFVKNKPYEVDIGKKFSKEFWEKPETTKLHPYLSLSGEYAQECKTGKISFVFNFKSMTKYNNKRQDLRNDEINGVRWAMKKLVKKGYDPFSVYRNAKKAWGNK